MLPLAAALLLARPDVLIAHTNIVDVQHGSLIKDVDLLIHDGKIARIGQQGLRYAAPAAEIVDGAGKYVIPGLWDMHVHWYDEPTLGLFTANGVTGARIMYGAPMHLAWKKRIEAGELVGPHLVVGSPIVDGPKPVWPGSLTAKNAEEGRAVVDKIATEGWEFVKVYSRLPRDAYFAIADECKRKGLDFEGHVPAEVTVLEASNAGQKSIEHLDGMILALSSENAKLTAEAKKAPEPDRAAAYWHVRAEAAKSESPELAQKHFRAFLKNHTWHCPTLVVNRVLGHLMDKDIDKDPRMKYVPAFYAKLWDPKNDFRLKAFGAQTFADMRTAFDADERILGEMSRAGVDILAGTDVGNPYCFPGFSLLDELSLMVESGLTPAEALRTATLNPARFLGRAKEMGTVSVGKQADLVILNANPLDNIENTRKIQAVIQSGHLYRRPDLDQLLIQAEQSSKR